MQYYGLKTLTLLIGILELIFGFYIFSGYLHHIPQQPFFFICFWWILTFIANIWSLKQFFIGYLISLFSFLVVCRIVSFYPLQNAMVFVTLMFFLYIIQLTYCVYENKTLTWTDWQLVFIRVYIAFDFIPHFTDKLFAGYPMYHQYVDIFQELQIPHSEFFVYMAGICELAAAIALGFGILLRLSALATSIYLFITAFLGHHTFVGFMWTNPYGGWEFPVFWAMMIFSFVLSGSHHFAVDEYWESRYQVPKWLIKWF
jgi:putative oxidoreductase